MKIRRGVIEIGTLGEGPMVVLHAGRGASATERLGALGTAVARAGFRAVAINPRGVGVSRGPMRGLTIHHLALDVVVAIRHCAKLDPRYGASAHIVGAALGNRVARCVAADTPACVRSLVLLGAGGDVVSPPGPRERSAPQVPGTSGDPMFAATKSWPEAGRAHARANRVTPPADWWSGGNAQILVIQGLDDTIAPPEHGRRLLAKHPDRVRLIEAERAGHAVYSDRPELVLPAVIEFLEEIEALHAGGAGPAPAEVTPSRG